MTELKPSIPILFFADDVLGIHPYDWQCRILLNYEAGTSIFRIGVTGKGDLAFPS